MPLPTLICFPFAGGGAAYFQPWQDALAGRFDVVSILLPGRERRLLEAPCETVEAAIDDTIRLLPDAVFTGPAITIFGHSLGAVLATAFAVRAQRERGARIARLVASGSPSPAAPRARHASDLDDETFLSRVEEFAGFDDPAMRDPEWRDLILPTLRADVAMHERHRSAAMPSDARITVVRGDRDQLVSMDDLRGWQALTPTPIEVVTLPGGHMYLNDDPRPLFDLLRSDGN